MQKSLYLQWRLSLFNKMKAEKNRMMKSLGVNKLSWSNFFYLKVTAK